MVITILTLFPQVFREIFEFSIVGKALKKERVKIEIVNIRDYAQDKHRTVDDKPYGGGTGMLLRVDVLNRAIEASKIKISEGKLKFKEKIILLDPSGKIFNQAKARKYSHLDHLILVCGHYEGVDSRINNFVDENISIGQYILTGGEIPAIVVTDSIVRLIPGVLSKREATEIESFTKKDLLEAPQWTRPSSYKQLKVPKILLSGDHGLVKQWRSDQALKRTRQNIKFSLSK
ncbi:tRNA (guanosine(37)-N1)-methyltransferase TrmD [Candidatus Gottesmanbacteria bacterium RIFCSPLOWO2_01_FULL_39_12b]|uniref:tRNA (guanine-N(1)-)-methyltransferase n=1 Tax=Candidatus Gottesmanbacteria bacterium RIFCSPLOWO2_01_FULL_39_12b TaxID=1798388 RepID=A0A1F6AQG4_9BACT|nr:MAG: tRNA (guanosine(37)-N1)-methyltransferase TrmD [Candidatus Gottesmanbacteria bacterium RIFCSPLOWO2_01_FULL_39_12b]